MSKKSRRLFRQRMNSVKKRHTDYLKYIIKDKIDLFQSYYNDVYKSSPVCSSIVSVRSKKRLLKQKSKLKNHWFASDTIKAIYGRSYCPKPRKLKNIRLKNKKYRILNCVSFEILRCKLQGRVYLKEHFNDAMIEMLKNQAVA